MSGFLITGGAGFIGSAIARGLLAQGADRVVIVDDLSSGRERNIAEIRGAVDFEKADIGNYDAMVSAMRGIEVVFHEAAIPSVPRSINDPIPSHDVNVNGTFTVLRAAKDAGVRRVIYAASSSAYGDSLVLPKVETMPSNPKSPYAAQKLMGEHYMSVWNSCFGLETISLRYFNVFGPRQDPGSPYSGVLSLFMTAVLDRRPPTIFGDGETSRDFTYVEDVVALNLRAAQAPSSTCGRMYNGGNGGRVTLNEAWALLQEIEGVTISANYGPERAGDVRDSQADTADAIKYLGHDPKFSFGQGIRDTLAWYRSNRG